MQRCKTSGLGIVLAVVLFGLSSEAALAAIDVEAIPGTPFGIGRLTVTVPPSDASAAAVAGGYLLEEENGRALYPAFSTGVFRRLLGRVLGVDTRQAPVSVTALFLFTGDEPLRLTLYTPTANRISVTPRTSSPRSHEQLLARWWREYNAAAREQQNQGDYPPLVQTYLTSMLSRRLGLEAPLLSRLKQQQTSEAKQTLELLLGTEKLRDATMKETILSGREIAEAADQPLPNEVSWLPLAVPPPDPDVKIEPIAMHVPEECFYIRFGTFSNYLWLSHLQDDYGGDVASMITQRGHDAELNQRMQRQLALQQNVLADLLGDQVIADVALIGRDLYTREGAAVGMLFQARNSVLGNDINQQRAAALGREKQNGATIKTVDIAGRKVSLLSTPDNRLRSFYAVDGHFHLVTTSQAIVERFFEAGAGERPLGAADEFRNARAIMPIDRDDTIFVYFSAAFFRGLVSPQYQVELARRIQSVTDMELVQMARLAARAEGRPAKTIEDLMSAGLLPRGFDKRADGSDLIVHSDGVIDSLRGARGGFVPIPDITLQGVTRSEAAKYAARSAYYREHWVRMDPLMIGIKRVALDRKGLQRVTIDAHIAPLDDTKYAWIMSSLGPPTTQRITAAPGDVISVQAALRGGLIEAGIPPHLLFLGVQDSPPPTSLATGGFLKTLQILQAAPWYLGAWPKPGFLDWLPFGLGGGEPDQFGYSVMPLGLWRRQWEDFSAVSFDRRLLDEVTPHLAVEQSDSAAQIRASVGDLSQSQLAGWINLLVYDRARQTSLGNARLMHVLSQQLHVPPEDALATAQQLIDAKLVCPLGGQYELVAHNNGTPLWRSTKWPAAGDDRVPADYQALVLEWFRGLDAHVTKYDDRLVIQAQLDMQRRPSAAKFELPFFNFFGGQKNSAKQALPPKAETSVPKPKAAPRKSPSGPREF
jgi:hypothetical protein